MEWKECIEAARQWTKRYNSQFELNKCIDKERKLCFSSYTGDVSFTVVIPECSDKLDVWSDDPRVVPLMADIMEYAEKKSQASLGDVLDRIAKELSSLIGATGSENDNSDENEDSNYSDDDIDDSYYNQDDEDAINDDTTKQTEEPSEAEKAFTGTSNNPVATQRLLKDLKALDSSNGKFHVHGIPRGDNLFIWDIKLTNFSKETPLGKDMQEFARKQKCEPAIYMEMKFPKEYPMSPPFARVVKPRFQFLTGHITVGGSVCMQVLTNSGWTPTNDIESILVQIRAEIMSDPKTRLDFHNDRPYDEREARDAFERMVKRYGWE